MEEEDDHQDKTVNGKCPGKLINLNAPLLSTRRTNNYIGMDVRLEMPNAANNSFGVSRDMISTCERIPFSWEQTPGKPKNYIETSAVATETYQNDDYLLPPRPPPGRWSHLIKTETAACWEEYYCNGSINKVDDGCDGDVDDDDDGISSNALDIFSLAESVDTNETRDDRACRSTLSSMEEEEEGGMNRVSPSPNFMIQRFLPDAKALAAASSSAFTTHKNNNYYHNNILVGSNYSCTRTSTTGAASTSSRAVSLRQSSPFSSSSKGGCGLDIFLPWRVKPKSSGIGSCGVKSPVMALPTSKLPSWSRGKLK